MQKAPILRKRLSKIEAHQGKLVIGIFGTHKGVGATHLGISLANYLSEWLGRKTAFIECYPQKDIQFIQYYVNGRIESKEDKEYFNVHRVTYYKNVKEQEIAEIVGNDYDCVVLDLGTDFNKGKNEFLRCDRRIVVSSLTIWKKQELEKFIVNTCHIKYSDQWTYVIPFVQSKDIKKAAKELHREIYEIPYEPDPFALSTDTIQLFQKLI